MTDERDIPADPDEPETPIPASAKTDGTHPDETRDVGVGTDEE